MVLELMLLFSSFILLAVLIILLVILSAEAKTPKKRFKVKDDIKKIKEQISQ
ncbi:MAG: hypothetical protein ABH864_04330 [archaeon]